MTKSINIHVGSWSLSFSLNNYGRLFVSKEEKPEEKDPKIEGPIDITPAKSWVSDFDVYYDQGNKTVEPSCRLAASVVFLDTPPSDMHYNIRFQSPFSAFGGGTHYIFSDPFVADQIYFRNEDHKLARTRIEGSQEELIGSDSSFSLASSSPFVQDGWLYFREEATDRLCKVKYDGSEKQQIGGQATSSRPFVTSDKWVYFRGTNDHLYKIKDDGSNFSEIPGCETSDSPFVSDNKLYFRSRDNKLSKKQLDLPAEYLTYSKPFVVGNWIYFQGTDNGLYKLKNDGTGIERIGDNVTKSTPFVDGEWVYFQGWDDGLYKVKTDGHNTTPIANNKTKSTPFVDGEWVYFQGLNDKLYKVKTDGTGTTQLGDNSIKSTPFVADGWVYFHGTFERLDDTLYRVKTDGSQGHPIGVQYLGRDIAHKPNFAYSGYVLTNSAVFVLDNYVYYKNKDDNGLYKIHVNNDAVFENNHVPSGSSERIFLGVRTKSSPSVTSDKWVYFQGIDDVLGRVNTDGLNFHGLHQSIFSAPFVLGDYVYGQGHGNRLIQIKSDNPLSEIEILGSSNTIVSAPFVSDDGYIYFKGTDNKLERVKTNGTELSWVGKAYTESSPVVIGDNIYYRNFGDNRLIAQKISIGDQTMQIIEDKFSKIYTTGNLDPIKPWDPTAMWHNLPDPEGVSAYCKDVIAITSNDVTSLFYPSYLSSIQLKMPEYYFYFHDQRWIPHSITESGTYTLSEVSLVKWGLNHSLICALRENKDDKESHSLYFTGNIFSNTKFTLMLNASSSSGIAVSNDFKLLKSAQYQSFSKGNNLIILSVEDAFSIGETEGIPWTDPNQKIYVFAENCIVSNKVKAKGISIFANKIDNLSLPSDKASTEILNKKIDTISPIDEDKEIINFWDQQKKQFFSVTVEYSSGTVKVKGTSTTTEPIDHLFVHPAQCQMLLQKALLSYSQGYLELDSNGKLKDGKLKSAAILFKRIKSKLEIFKNPPSELETLYAQYEENIGAIKSIETMQNIYNTADAFLLQIKYSQDYWGNSYSFVPTESYKYWESQLQSEIDNLKDIENDLTMFLAEETAAAEKRNILKSQVGDFEATKSKAIQNVVLMQDIMAETARSIEVLQSDFKEKSKVLYDKINDTKNSEEAKESSNKSFAEKHPWVNPVIQAATSIGFLGMATPGLGEIAGGIALGGILYSLEQGIKDSRDRDKVINAQAILQEKRYIVNKLAFLSEELNPDTLVDETTKLQDDGTIDIDNLSANKLLVDQNAFENFISGLHESHPELASIKKEFEASVRSVIDRNNEILTYNAQANLLRQYLTTIQNAVNQQDIIGEENLKNYNPDSPAFIGSMQQAYKNAQSNVMLLFYNTERALQFYGPTDSRPFVDSIQGSVLNHDIFKAALSEIRHQYNGIREKIIQNNTYYHFTGVKIYLGERAIEKLKTPLDQINRSKDQVIYSTSVNVLHNHDVGEYNNVRITDVKVHFQGIRDKVYVDITNKGIEKITDLKGQQFTFQHEPIRYSFTYDPKDDKPSEFQSARKKRDDIIDSKESKYISGEEFLPGLFAEWQIDIPIGRSNPDLEDLTGLSGVSIEFEGYGYH